MPPPVVHIGHTLTVRFIHVRCFLWTQWDTDILQTQPCNVKPSKLSFSPLLLFLALSCLCCAPISLSPIMILSDPPPQYFFKQTHILQVYGACGWAHAFLSYFFFLVHIPYLCWVFHWDYRTPCECASVSGRRSTNITGRHLEVENKARISVCKLSKWQTQRIKILHFQILFHHKRPQNIHKLNPKQPFSSQQKCRPGWRKRGRGEADKIKSLARLQKGRNEDSVILFAQ